MAGYWQIIRSFRPSLQRFLIASAILTTVVFGILAVLQNLFLLRLGFAVFQAIIPATAFAGSLIAGLLPGLFAGIFGMTLDQAAPDRLALWVGPALLLLATLPVWEADRGKTTVHDTQQTDWC